MFLYISAHLHQLAEGSPPTPVAGVEPPVDDGKNSPRTSRTISRTLPRVTAPEVEAAIGEDTAPAMDTTVNAFVVIVIPEQTEQRHQIHLMH